MSRKDTLLAVSGLLGGGSGGGGGGPTITLQPADFTGALDAFAQFHVEAAGTGLTYKWQSNTTGSWADTSFATSTTDTVSVMITAARDGKQYRCRITDGAGNTVYSHPATLRITGSAGPARSESGSFIITASGGATTKTITHSLGTDRVFGMIWTEPDENGEINATQGYTLIFCPFISKSFQNEILSGSTLVCNYTSSETKTAAYTDQAYPYFSRIRSKWKNEAAGFEFATMATTCTVTAATADSITVTLQNGGGSAVANFGRDVPYKWKLWSLED